MCYKPVSTVRFTQSKNSSITDFRDIKLVSHKLVEADIPGAGTVVAFHDCIVEINLELFEKNF